MKKAVSKQGAKRTGSPISDVLRSEAKKRSWKRVEIPDDSWLLVLKFLPGLQWPKMRLVSPEFNRLIESNISRLPIVIVESAEIKLKKRKMPEIKLVVSNSIILPEEKDQWFQNCGIAVNMFADSQLDNAIIGPAQKKKLTPKEKRLSWFSGQQYKARVLFYAEFSPHRNQSSLASMAFFLKLLYDPSTYVKKLSMFSLDKKLRDILFPGEEERYIRCGSFTLQVPTGANVEELCQSVSWMEQNVQAVIIQFPTIIENASHNDPNAIKRNKSICDGISDFILGTSWRSANQTVNLGYVADLTCFFHALIRKFRTMVAVQGTIPIITLYGRRNLKEGPLSELLPYTGIGKENIRMNNKTDCDESDTLNIYEIYTVSYGANRLRIEFFSEQPVFMRRDSYKYDIRVTLEANESFALKNE